jgi:glycyl-tRNA synthetase beta subunit
MDNFRKYLQENADKLDCDVPREEVLAELHQRILNSRKHSYYRIMYQYAKVACITVFIGLTTWLILIHDKSSSLIVNTSSPQILKNHTLPGDSPILGETPINLEKAHLYTKSLRKRYTVANTDKSKAPVTDAAALEAQKLEAEMKLVINNEENVVNTTPILAESPAYFEYFKEEFKKITQEESAIKVKVQKYGMNDLFLAQLINIYQEKLNVLKELQLEISKINALYKNKEQPSKIKPSYLQL